MRLGSKSGFTLVELIIVIGIIAVLAVVLLAVLMTAQGRGDIGRAENFVNNVIPSAIQKWQDENGKSSNDFPHSGVNAEGAYHDGNVLLYAELVTKPKAAGKPPYVSPDLYSEVQVGGKPAFGDPWSRPYIYRNYTAKPARDAATREYRGVKKNSTFDLISMGPDGKFDNGEGDDIYNGK